MRIRNDNSVNLEGRNVVIEAIKRKRKIFEILIDRSAKGNKIDELKQIASQRNIKVTETDRGFLDKISLTDSHQGIIAKAEPLRLYTLNEVLKIHTNPFIILIMEVLYEHNLGAIMRSAAAAGAHAIVVSSHSSKSKSIITPVVERVSMGGSNVVKVCEESLQSALSILNREGIKIVGVEVSGEKDYFEEDLTGSLALVLGGEDESLSLPVIKKCDIVVRVPMKNDIQSLNLSVSAGILMYEKVAQEKKKYGNKA